MTWITFVGLFAACCTTLAFLPQAIKTVRSKETKDIALSMYLIMTTGVFSWLVYGLLIKDIPIIAANAVTLILVLWVLILKLKYG